MQIVKNLSQFKILCVALAFKCAYTKNDTVDAMSNVRFCIDIF